MTTPASPSLLPHLWKSALVSGVLAIVLGVAIVAWPQISIAVAAIFFGAYLLLTGIQQVVFAFSLHVSAGGRVLLFISGAASLILAVLAFRHLYDAVLLMAIWIAIGFVFRGVATTVSAISDPTLPGRELEHLRRHHQPHRRCGGPRVAVHVVEHPRAGRGHLADRHRRHGGRCRLRHPQYDQEGRRSSRTRRRRSRRLTSPTKPPADLVRPQDGGPSPPSLLHFVVD